MAPQLQPSVTRLFFQNSVFPILKDRTNSEHICTIPHPQVVSLIKLNHRPY